MKREWNICMRDIENVKQARESFNRIIDNKKYANIIKDDKHLAAIMKLIEGGNYCRILDIGTGTGYLAFPLSEKYPSSVVYGIDIAEKIIDKNNLIVKEKDISNLSFEVFDGLKYPFEDETFDLIVTRYAFHHFPDVVDAIQQMNRILVKGGKVLISDPMRHEKDVNGIIDEYMKVKKDGHIQFYSSKQLDELFENNGFGKEKQLVTIMKFPFASSVEYIDVYDKTSDGDKSLYSITNENGIVWVGHIDVENTVFVKM